MGALKGLVALTAVLLALAEPAMGAASADVDLALKPGSTAFCLYELPVDGNGGRRRWLNLGIVQYVEIGSSELTIYFGGGNLGSGHEARIPVASYQDALAVLQKMNERARACN